MPQMQKSSWLTPRAARDARGWWVVDLEGQVLGRAATKIASVLRGKHKPSFTPNVDSGDYVVVINADKVKLTGQKTAQKLYRKHTGWIGGLKETTADDLLATHPERVIESAVWGMLPKTKLGKQIIKKLKIYSGKDHSHAAQSPQPLALQ